VQADLARRWSIVITNSQQQCDSLPFVGHAATRQHLLLQRTDGRTDAQTCELLTCAADGPMHGHEQDTVAHFDQPSLLTTTTPGAQGMQSKAKRVRLDQSHKWPTEHWVRWPPHSIRVINGQLSTGCGGHHTRRGHTHARECSMHRCTRTHSRCILMQRTTQEPQQQLAPLQVLPPARRTSQSHQSRLMQQVGWHESWMGSR
jgi:hypothetical protein